MSHSKKAKNHFKKVHSSTALGALLVAVRQKLPKKVQGDKGKVSSPRCVILP